MDHIAHLRKQFKSINTYDYIITLIRRKENPFSSFWELNGSLFEQPKGALCQVWLKLTHWFERKRFLNFDIKISLFRYYLPFEKGMSLHLNNLIYPFTQGWFVPSLIEIGQVVLKKKIFKNRQSIFTISSLSPLGKKEEFFI